MSMRRTAATLASLLVLLFGLLSSAAFAEPPIPPLTGRVVDNAHVLSPSTVTSLTSRLQIFEQQTTNQLVVVTLPGLNGYQIEDWGLALLRGWGIGQKGRNNGIVLVVAPNDRQLRIEVGYGLEGSLPDATAYRIIQDEIIPRFKSGNIDAGVTAGVDAIIAAVGGTYKPTSKPLLTQSSPMQFVVSNAGGIIFFLIFIALLVHRFINPGYRFGRYRRGYYSSYDDGWSSGGRSSGGWSSGGGSFGGGGFSGGGGSGGGGGASGRW